MNIEKSALSKIQEYIRTFELENYQNSNVKRNQYNFESTLIKNKEKLKLLVYFGKKGVKTVLQGNTLSKEYREAESIISGNLALVFDNEQEREYHEYIGTDETGKGDYFGPLVVAGMYVSDTIIKFLVNIGVRDSKELSDTQIDSLAKQIKKKYPNNFSLVVVKPEKYNKLYESFKNVNKLLNWAHSKAIETLVEKYPTKIVITDQFSKTKLDISNNVKYSEIEFIQMPRAESHVGVAAASILARHEMNKWFNRQSQNGYRIQKGSSFEVQQSAKNILIRYGQNQFNKFVKLHFKTTQRILEEITNT